jgi:hypothetical protein
MTPYVHYPDDDRGSREPTEPTDRSASFDEPFERPFDPEPGAPRAAKRSPLAELLRDPRRRMLLVAAAALAVLLAVVTLWYGDPTNRARRDLAQANERIVEKQRQVADARRLLAERIAELRAAQAEAEVRATRYQSAIDRATRPPELDSAIVGGEVEPGAGVRADTAAVTPPRRP